MKFILPLIFLLLIQPLTIDHTSAQFYIPSSNVNYRTPSGTSLYVVLGKNVTYQGYLIQSNTEFTHVLDKELDKESKIRYDFVNYANSTTNVTIWFSYELYNIITETPQLNRTEFHGMRIVVPPGFLWSVVLEQKSRINRGDITYARWFDISLQCFENQTTTCVIPNPSLVFVKSQITILDEGNYKLKLALFYTGLIALIIILILLIVKRISSEFPLTNVE